MYRVELIAKQSVMSDIRKSWVNSGRKDNSDSGVFIFERACSAFPYNGMFEVTVGVERFFYNPLDFYRIKVTNMGD